MILFLLVFHSYSQNRKSSKIKLFNNKPSVHISFEKKGKWQPLREDEKGEGIVLRLHNNMRYSISFCAFGISDGEQLAFRQKGSALVPNYAVELTNLSDPNEVDSNEIEQIKQNVPVGYLVGGICHVYTLKSGNSLLFAVPAEHLAKGLSIKIPFNYEWEEESEDNPTHFVYFNSASIPKK